jgi:hypothetical protein
VEAERSILGAILLDNFSYNQAAEHSSRRLSLDFAIYTRMMTAESQSIDMITLVEEFDPPKNSRPSAMLVASPAWDSVPTDPASSTTSRLFATRPGRGLIHTANCHRPSLRPERSGRRGP